MKISLLVTDLDNTLYDWIGFFTEAFYAMVDEAAVLLNVERNLLLDQLRAVHFEKGDTEYPFSLLETEIVARRFPGASRQEKQEALDAAFHAFNKTRKASMKTFPGVDSALAAFHRAGIPIVGHTEALIPNALFRLRKLGLEPLFTALYAREHACNTHPVPGHAARFMQTDLRLIHLGEDQRKPNPEILERICTDFGVLPGETVYVGDSLSRDMGMAREAGAVAAWAQYGTHFDPRAWQRLVRVSHWSSEDVRHAETTRKQYADLVPDIVLKHSFSELFDHIELTRDDPVAAHA